MLFIIENQQDFHTSAYVHGLDTRNKSHLYLPALSLTCVQKGVLYSGSKSLIIYQATYRITNGTQKIRERT
jgi:hypothetical protein